MPKAAFASFYLRQYCCAGNKRNGPHSATIDIDITALLSLFASAFTTT
jgi:hypothetical protein